MPLLVMALGPAAPCQVHADPPSAADPASAAVAAAARLRATEAKLDTAERREASLDAERMRSEAALRADWAFLAPLLPVLRRLSTYPAETLLTAPVPPGEAVQGLAVLKGLLAAARMRATDLAAERDRIAADDSALGTERAALRSEAEAQAAQSRSLDLLAARAEAESRRDNAEAEAEARRASAHAARAPTLSAAVARLAPLPSQPTPLPWPPPPPPTAMPAHAPPARPPPAHATAATLSHAIPPPAPVATDAGSWTMPVAGTVAVAFGAPGDDGPASGATLVTPAGARVVSPCAGPVAFAQRFRSYGLLVIVDCGQSRHVVLSGLARLDVEAGQTLRAGQPVGVMPPADPVGRPKLYVELRQGSVAVNPSPLVTGAR